MSIDKNVENLFQVGGPVVKEQFYNRKEILGELEGLTEKKSTLGFALYGSRRTGKTSILKEFVRRTGNKKAIIPVYLDVSGVHPFNAERFYDKVFSSTIDAFREKGKIPLKTNIAEILKGSLSGFVDVIRDTEVSLSIKEYLELKVGMRDSEPDLQKLLEKAFNAIEELSQETGCRGILILDEFPFIENFGIENISWAIRSITQNWKDSCLVIAGSSVSMMRELTSAKTAPFYMLLQVRRIEPFDEKTSAGMIKGRFKRINMKVDDESLKSIFDLTHGFPFYLQWLGDRIYDNLAGNQIDKGVIEKAYAEIMKEGEVIFSADLEKLSNGERDVLVGTAISDTGRISSVSKQVKKSAAVTGKMIERLMEKGYLQRIDSGLYDFNDPLLKGWLRRRYSIK